MTMAEGEDSMITTLQRVNSPTVAEIKATKNLMLNTPIPLRIGGYFYTDNK